MMELRLCVINVNLNIGGIKMDKDTEEYLNKFEERNKNWKRDTDDILKLFSKTAHHLCKIINGAYKADERFGNEMFGMTVMAILITGCKNNLMLKLAINCLKITLDYQSYLISNLHLKILKN